jgi:hypothetical protein
MKIQEWGVPLAIIAAAAMICGTGWFIYQDFKPDFDKYQQMQSKAYQDELDALQSQNETFKDQASAIIYFESKQMAEDEQKKIQTGSGLKIPNIQDDREKEIADALNGIWDELNRANQINTGQGIDSSIEHQQSLDELKRMRENQENQQIMNIGK